MEPITFGKGAVAAFKAAVMVKAKLAEFGPTARIEEAWGVEQRSWRAERDAHVETRLARLEGQRPELERAVAAMVEDRQFARLQEGFANEADREITDDRRRLLAYVAAGLTDPSLSINDKARVQRAVRDLDAEDVLLLHEVDTLTDPSFQPDPNNNSPAPSQLDYHLGGLRRDLVEQRPFSQLALLGTMCIVLDGEAWGPAVVKVTPLGALLLSVLTDYFEECDG